MARTVVPTLVAVSPANRNHTSALTNVNVVIYLVAVLATLFTNPVLMSVGPLELYLATLAWAGAAMAWACWLSIVGLSADTAERRAVGRLVLACFSFVVLVGASVAIHGVHEQTIGNLFRLSFVAVGIAAALVVVDHAVTVVRVVTVLVGLKCVAVLALALTADGASLAARIHLRELGGHNSTATLLAILIALRLSLSILRPVGVNLLEAGAIAAMFLVLCLTFSRGGFLGLTAGVGAIVVLNVWPVERERRPTRPHRFRRLLPLAVGLVAGLVWIARDQALSDRLLRFGGGNLSGRDRVWGAALDAIDSNPLLGIGFGRFSFTDPVLADVFADGPTTFSTHNVPLQMVTDFGLVGAAALAVVVMALVRAFWNIVILPPLAALAAASLFGDVFAVVQVSWVIGLVLVTGLALRTTAERVAADQVNDVRTAVMRAATAAHVRPAARWRPAAISSAARRSFPRISSTAAPMAVGSPGSTPSPASPTTSRSAPHRP